MKHESVIHRAQRSLHQVRIASHRAVEILQKEGSRLFGKCVEKDKPLEARNKGTQTKQRANAGNLADTVAREETYQKKIEVPRTDWDVKL